MRATNIQKAFLQKQLLLVAVAVLLASTAHAAVPGITGGSFNLTAKPAFTSQPDGSLIYNLPALAGNTSILFPGLRATSAPSGGVVGLLTQEAEHNGQVTYHLIA